MNARETFEIVLLRLPGGSDVPGLIQLRIETSRPERRSRSMGTLTDSGLRGRLAHFDLHSANEIAAIRQALAKDAGEASVRESWPGLEGCVRFWERFTGSQIQQLGWNCAHCAARHEENVGGSVGESFSRRCSCGAVNKVTIPKPLLQIPQPSRSSVR